MPRAALAKGASSDCFQPSLNICLAAHLLCNMVRGEGDRVKKVRAEPEDHLQHMVLTKLPEIAIEHNDSPNCLLAYNVAPGIKWS